MTDQLRSYLKPVRDIVSGTDHRTRKGMNNRIEGSYRPTRRPEKIMGRFNLPRQAQRFLAAHDQINTVFRPLPRTVMPEPMLSTSGAAMRSK